MTVARSPDDVLAVVANYGTNVEWRKGLTDTTPEPLGPPAVGTKVHEVLQTGGRSYVADSTVTQVGAMTSIRGFRHSWQADVDSYRRCRRITV